jgi:hypothetical protein
LTYDFLTVPWEHPDFDTMVGYSCDTTDSNTDLTWPYEYDNTNGNGFSKSTNTKILT